MLAGMADGSSFTQDDVANWATGGAGGGAAPAAGSPSGGEGGPMPGETSDETQDEGGGPADPCDVLRDAAVALSDIQSSMSGYTLKDGEDKKFKKRWEALMDEVETLSTEASEMADEHEEGHEEEEETEEKDDGDEEGDEADDDEEDAGGDGG